MCQKGRAQPPSSSIDYPYIIHRLSIDYPHVYIYIYIYVIYQLMVVIKDHVSFWGGCCFRLSDIHENVKSVFSLVPGKQMGQSGENISDTLW